ncbi:hypothetical protein ACRWQL_19745 [Shewanella sp. HL-SH4]|uniref:hypothetical protein n=1 Tax=Shewanella sp. HL-SH4 TaxID=3436240 RepID=UPI003EBF90EE
MKHLIQFEFVCLKPVPLYAYLCHYFTLRTEFDISFGIVKDDKQLTHYIIEACALQTELESLADEIAANFLLSVWLVDTEIKRIHNKQFPPWMHLNHYHQRHCFFANIANLFLAIIKANSLESLTCYVLTAMVKLNSQQFNKA